MLFIALTEWTSKVNNTGKSHVLTIKEKSLVTQCMVAVIPDIQTQEAIMPKKKLTKYNLRKETSHHPKINTDRFKNTFVNRLIFKHNLVL